MQKVDIDTIIVARFCFNVNSYTEINTLKP